MTSVLEHELREAFDRAFERHGAELIGPNIDGVREGAEHRRRHRMMVTRVAMVSILVVAIGAAATAWLHREPRDRIVNDVPPTELTPLTSRLFPSDPVVGPVDFAYSSPGGLPRSPFVRTLTTQLWELDGEVVVATQTDSSAMMANPGGRYESVWVVGWDDVASLITAPDGTVSLFLFDGDRAVTRVFAGRATRGEMLALGAAMRPRTDRSGVDIEASALPAGVVSTLDVTEDAEGVVDFHFSGPIIDGTAVQSFQLSGQTPARLAFDRLVDPPDSTVSIRGEVGDVRHDGPTVDVRWQPLPGLQAVVSVGGSHAEAVAIRVAESVEQVDEATWQELLTTAFDPETASGDEAAPRATAAAATEVPTVSTVTDTDLPLATVLGMVTVHFADDDGSVSVGVPSGFPGDFFGIGDATPAGTVTVTTDGAEPLAAVFSTATAPEVVFARFRDDAAFDQQFCAPGTAGQPDRCTSLRTSSATGAGPSFSGRVDRPGLANPCLEGRCDLAERWRDQATEVRVFVRDERTIIVIVIAPASTD